MRVGQAVGRALVDDQLRVLHEPGGRPSRRVNRHDLVIVAVQDQCWDVKFLQIRCPPCPVVA